MEKIYNIKIERNDTSFAVSYSYTKGLCKYCKGMEKFEVDYFEDISDIPDSILVVPFVTNLLPLIWLTNSELELNEIDETFFKCIPQVKEGYMKMSPMLKFGGNVTASILVKNQYQNCGVASLFSGGLDAFSTLISHIEEKPRLFTIWGADITQNDIEGWNIVKQHSLETATYFSLPGASFAKCNLRTFLKEYYLERLVYKSGDSWWHGYQHGIGMLGLFAPLAYKYQIGTVYIASSFTQGDKEICASDPTIDNFLTYGSTRIIHDQYDYSRQDKIRNVSNYCDANNCRIQLRVCWESQGGKNCCQCEKCLRTIFGLLAEGNNPENFGLYITDEQLKKSREIVIQTLKEKEFLKTLWLEIQKRFLQTSSYKDNPNINWIHSIKMTMKPSINRIFYKKIHRYFSLFYRWIIPV